ncbi:MAG: (d)CMP kinase [Acidimicrobiia bacterium]|nr:(d)CMP kinase [Acidimicrobiia bacterium]
MVIAIDGPGGVGKTTVTRRLATLLGIEYLDTGATYRAAAVAALRGGVDPHDEPAVLAAVQSSEIAYEDGVIFLDGEPVVAATRSEGVTKAVTPVSAHPRVRQHIVALQRQWVADRGGQAVVEGRDIGTVVFPDALVKVYLTASPEVRAARRAGDTEASQLSVSEIAADLHRRDHADSTRQASPLRKAEDAVEIDTSVMDVEEVVAAILELVAEGRTGSNAEEIEGTGS